jgi:predicted outer membrane repeat protein
VCESCPLHTFAPAGSTACTPSGCTDEWALNFDSSASIDDGSCEYACSDLLANAGYTPADKCLIYNGDVWTAYYSNGTASFGSNTSGVDTIGTAVTKPTFVASNDCSWVIQGKPLRGSTVAARNLRISSSDFVRFDLLMGIKGNATVRMVSIVAQASLLGPDNERKAVTIDARANTAGRTSQQQQKTKVVFFQVAFEANACGSASLGSLVTLEGNIEFLEMTFADNWSTEGAGLHAFVDAQMVVKHSHFTRNTATNNGGGAHIQLGSHLSVEFTVFEDNTARRGGAIFVSGSSEAVVKHSVFARNIAEISGGGIATILSGLELNGCQFESNDAVSLGAALHVDQPPRVKIVDTTFNPYLEGAGIVFIGGKLAGCEEHPCPLGYACSYAQYSLQCTACPELQMSEAGLQCGHCGAGFQPNQDQTGCVPCEGNTYSTSGQCKPCVGTASEDKKQCQICPLNQVADPPELGCRCENGYYNTSAGQVLCFRRDQPYDAARTLAPLPIDPNLFCQECPSDCVDCVYPGYAGKPIIRQGYASPTSAAEADWFDTLPRVVFECPVDKDACLAEAAPVDNNSSTTLMSSDKLCKEGYRGILCTMCSEGYSLGGMGCDECEELTPASAVAAAVLFLIAIGGIVHMSRSLKKVGGSKGLRHVIALLPELLSDAKVFIGLYQVLCSMGPTLEITCKSAADAFLIQSARTHGRYHSCLPTDPEPVERFISAIRGFSNFDIFSIPGLACMFGSTVFGKFVSPQRSIKQSDLV